MLQKTANWIVDHRRVLVIVMTILTIGCTVLLPFVKINYDMTKYLPPHSSMKISRISGRSRSLSSGSSFPTSPM